MAISDSVAEQQKTEPRQRARLSNALLKYLVGKIVALALDGGITESPCKRAPAPPNKDFVILRAPSNNSLQIILYDWVLAPHPTIRPASCPSHAARVPRKRNRSSKNRRNDHLYGTERQKSALRIHFSTYQKTTV